MDDTFLGEIRLFALQFEPHGWAFCDGRLLRIQDHRVLFALIGNTYGGDGLSNFALPDLRDRALIGAGSGEGLTPRSIGDAPGTWSVGLTVEEMPAHVHAVSGTLAVLQETGSTVSPAGAYLSITGTEQFGETVDGPPMAADLLSGTAEQTGTGEAHDNMMPSLIMTYAICLTGDFPG